MKGKGMEEGRGKKWGRQKIILFHIAAATNCHKLSDLKQQKFILLEIWRSEA